MQLTVWCVLSKKLIALLSKKNTTEARQQFFSESLHSSKKIVKVEMNIHKSIPIIIYAINDKAVQCGHTFLIFETNLLKQYSVKIEYHIGL